MKNLLNSLSEEELHSLVRKAEVLWKNCLCCPNECRTDRLVNNPPCGAVNNGLKVASFAVHEGEEPPVSGYNGAGNIFFSGCTLGCVFCQNWPISHDNNGRVYSEPEFIAEVRKLLARKVHNINLVTSDHYIYPLLSAFAAMRADITVPVVYNCSGYFAKETLEIVLRFADIYLYDVKYSDPAIAARYSRASKYVEHDWMGMKMLFDAKIPYIENDIGILERGVIIRHLVLPGAVKNSLDTLDGLAKYRDNGMDLRLSLMSQYFPAYRAMQTDEFAEINRRLEKDEYRVVAERAEALGLEGWIQDLD